MTDPSTPTDSPIDSPTLPADGPPTTWQPRWNPLLALAPYHQKFAEDPILWGPFLDKQLERLPSLLVKPPDHRPAFAAPSDRILLRAAHLTSWTGYGQIACETAKALAALNIPVVIESPHVDERYYRIPRWIKSRLTDRSPDGWVLNLGTPTTALPTGRYVCAWSMWEASRISRAAAENLNRADAVIVPCRFNEIGFQESGVTRPIHVVPLGVNPKVYFDADDFPAVDGPFIFGAAGRYAHGGTRKNLDFAAQCFARVADKMPDARLVLKIWKDCNVSGIPDHSRIDLDRRPMSPRRFARWCRSLACYVNPSRGEGWGMIGHQAMACGRPMIAAPWSATVDFWDASLGWPLDFTTEPAGDFYEGQGEWAVPSEESLCEAMLAAYRDRDECKRKGKLAAERMAGFTWARTAAGIRAALVAAGALIDPDRQKNAGPPNNGLATGLDGLAGHATHTWAAHSPIEPAVVPTASPFPPNQAELDRLADIELVKSLTVEQSAAVSACTRRKERAAGCCTVTYCEVDEKRIRTGRSVTAECGRCRQAELPR